MQSFNPFFTNAQHNFCDIVFTLKYCILSATCFIGSSLIFTLRKMLLGMIFIVFHVKNSYQKTIKSEMCNYIRNCITLRIKNTKMCNRVNSNFKNTIFSFEFQ